MFKDIPTPPSFTFIRKGKVFLLLKDDYKDSLLHQGIEDVETFLQKQHPVSRHLKGRTLHPCVPMGDDGWMVVRRYSHGGLLRGITRDLYLLGARSFRELGLTEEIRSCEIPTIEPMGAIHRRVFPFFYRSHILSREIPSAMDLIQFLEEIGPHPGGETLLQKRKTIRSAALLLRRFHQAGFFHADLQLKNLLVAGDQLFLIDFDRSYRTPSLSPRKRMRNLLRLDRSVEKWKRRGLTVTRGDRWRFFLAYAGDDPKIQTEMRKAVRSPFIGALLYRR